VVVPMVHTTLSKEDKVHTSLAARPRSKTLIDNLTDDDPSLLNLDAVESEIVC
jgi:hypothetical protein